MSRPRAHTTWLEIPADHPARRRRGHTTQVECHPADPEPRGTGFGSIVPGSPREGLFVTPSGRVFFPPGYFEPERTAARERHEGAAGPRLPVSAERERHRQPPEVVDAWDPGPGWRNGRVRPRPERWVEPADPWVASARPDPTR